LLLLAGGMFAVAAVITATSPREPCYHGRALSAWVESYAQEVADKRDEETDLSLGAVTPSEDAIRHIGTNALPYLLEWIAYESPQWSRGLDKLPPWLQDNWISRSIGLKATRASAALYAFAALGPEAKPAIPELARRMMEYDGGYSAGLALALIGGEALPALLIVQTNQNPDLRGSAVHFISQMGSNALPAVPVLTHCLQDPAFGVAAGAAVALGELHLDPVLVVPALAASLQHSNSTVRRYAADALGHFGHEALPAVPGLLQACNDPDERVRWMATNALLKTAPEALTNAAPK